MEGRNKSGFAISLRIADISSLDFAQFVSLRADPSHAAHWKESAVPLWQRQKI
jgi:hypothetical protein